MPSDPKHIRRALLSVSDKTGRIEFARALALPTIPQEERRFYAAYPHCAGPHRVAVYPPPVSNKGPKERRGEGGEGDGEHHWRPQRER